MEQIFEEFIRTETIMITSTVTCTEYLTYPYRTNNQEKVDAFFEFLTDCSIQIIPIDLYAAKKAAQIRGIYKDFKTMDCLQLAVACQQNCNLILTNDKQLLQFKDIKCITIEKYIL